MEARVEAKAQVHFYKRPVVDPAATKEAGRTIHKDAEYVRISIPGDRNNEVDRPVKKMDRELYPAQYERFERNAGEDVSGTMLSAWGALDASTVADYRYQKVLTVEHLAELSDSTVAKLGRGTLANRQKARDFMQAAKSNAPLLRVQSELASRDEQIAALHNALKEQGDRLEALAADKGLPARAVREVAPPETEAAPEGRSSVNGLEVAPPEKPKAKRGRPRKEA